MRVGTKVRMHCIGPEHGKTGKVCRVTVPGQTSKIGTAGFKFVKLDECGTVAGYFTNQLETIG